MRSLFTVTKRLFSNAALINKSILVPGGLGDTIPPSAVTFLTDRGATVDILKCSDNGQQRKADLIEILKKKKYHALYVGFEDPIDDEVIHESQPECRVISTMSVGYNHIHINSCKECGIRVGYTPEILSETTADLVVGLTLATARKFIESNHAVYRGEWGTWSPLWMAGKDVWGSTVGIIGMGRIGIAVAKRFHGFGCNIIYSNRSGEPHLQAEEFGCRLTSMQTLLTESDFVIPLCPLTKETTNLMSTREFSNMKNDAILINCSRGNVVDQEALIQALENGEILAAGLDVTVPEPLPLDHPLLKLQNCTILPHIGSASIVTRNKMAILASQNILDVFENRESAYFVC